LKNLAVFWTNTPLFFANCFGENILIIITSVSGFHFMNRFW
jgi:hypothetical protein